MSDVLALVHWPVLIKYADYEELGYVADASGWETEVGQNGAYLNSTDRVVDSAGVAFSMSEAVDGQKSLKQAQSNIGLDEILSWVRAHASMQGHCCVAKLSASSIAEVFTIIKSLDD